MPTVGLNTLTPHLIIEPALTSQVLAVTTIAVREYKPDIDVAAQVVTHASAVSMEPSFF